MTQPSVDANTALVTGASSGIGRETARLLTEKGYEVISVARRKDRLEDMAKDNRAIIPYRADLSDPKQVEKLCAYIKDLARPLSVLVNNAGYSIRGVVEEAPMAAIRRMFEVNVFTLIRLTQAVLKGMRRKRAGTIVNLSSVVGKFTFPGSGPYAAAKHAVESITDALRHEVAPFGIRVIVVRPGPIATEFNDVATEMTGDVIATADKDNRPIYEATGAAFGKMFSQMVLPGPEDVAKVIVEAITADKPKAAYAIGPFTDDILPLRQRLDDDEWKAAMDERVGLAGLKL